MKIEEEEKRKAAIVIDHEKELKKATYTANAKAKQAEI